MPTRKPIPQKSAADFVENLSILGKAILIIRENRIAATIIYGLVVGFLGYWSGVFTSFFATTKTVAIVAAAGSFTIYANAAATAATRVNFLVLN